MNRILHPFFFFDLLHLFICSLCPLISFLTHWRSSRSSPSLKDRSTRCSGEAIWSDCHSPVTQENPPPKNWKPQEDWKRFFYFSSQLESSWFPLSSLLPVVALFSSIKLRSPVRISAMEEWVGGRARERWIVRQSNCMNRWIVLHQSAWGSKKKGAGIFVQHEHIQVHQARVMYHQRLKTWVKLLVWCSKTPTKSVVYCCPCVKLASIHVSWKGLALYQLFAHRMIALVPWEASLSWGAGLLSEVSQLALATLCSLSIIAPDLCSNQCAYDVSSSYNKHIYKKTKGFPVRVLANWTELIKTKQMLWNWPRTAALWV